MGYSPESGTNYPGSRVQVFQAMQQPADNAHEPHRYTQSHEPTTMDASELMEILFWIDEFNPAAINLFQLETYPGEKCNSSEDTAVRYHDSDNWPAHPPVGMWFNYGVLNDFMKEWVLRKEELKSGKITRDEYFEWKINWPQTCDGCGKYEPKRQWRSANAELSET